MTSGSVSRRAGLPVSGLAAALAVSFGLLVATAPAISAPAPRAATRTRAVALPDTGVFAPVAEHLRSRLERLGTLQDGGVSPERVSLLLEVGRVDEAARLGPRLDGAESPVLVARARAALAIQDFAAAAPLVARLAALPDADARATRYRWESVRDAGAAIDSLTRARLAGPDAEAIPELLAAARPDVVFTHWPIDTHLDHQVASLLTFRAALALQPAFPVFYFEVNAGDQTRCFVPTAYVDIGTARETKKRALFAHVSQDGEAIYRRHHELMESFRGREAGCAAAEAFARLAVEEKQSAARRRTIRHERVRGRARAQGDLDDRGVGVLVDCHRNSRRAIVRRHADDRRHVGVIVHVHAARRSDEHEGCRLAAHAALLARPRRCRPATSASWATVAPHDPVRCSRCSVSSMSRSRWQRPSAPTSRRSAASNERCISAARASAAAAAARPRADATIHATPPPATRQTTATTISMDRYRRVKPDKVNRAGGPPPSHSGTMGGPWKTANSSSTGS